MTLSNSRSGDSNVSWLDFGSTGKTSIAAPPMCPVSSAKASASIRRLGHVQADDVSLREQLLEAIHCRGVPKGELVLDVVVQDAHPEPLREDPELAPDSTIAHDAQALSANFVCMPCGLRPFAAVRPSGLLWNPPHQQNDVGDRKLGDAAGVGKRSIEHGDAHSARRIQIDLVGADAKAADGFELLRGAENRGVDLGARADAD
jgi:hypothetical protein